ncbi:hypothetical protein V8G54_010403 [Vigna mungo]|uniref:Uncharacterized protein n=1 Tax=Vigna mungo TaxID=3915 RepID=A0AAQ3NYG2_VIGMU
MADYTHFSAEEASLMMLMMTENGTQETIGGKGYSQLYGVDYLKFNLTGYNLVRNPIVSGTNLSKDEKGSRVDVLKFRQVVESTFGLVLMMGIPVNLTFLTWFGPDPHGLELEEPTGPKNFP